MSFLPTNPYGGQNYMFISVYFETFLNPNQTEGGAKWPPLSENHDFSRTEPPHYDLKWLKSGQNPKK